MADNWLKEMGFAGVLGDGKPRITQDEDTGVYFDKLQGRFILFSPIDDKNTPGELFLAPRGRNVARFLARGFSPKPFKAEDVTRALAATAVRKQEEEDARLLEESRRIRSEEHRLERVAEAQARADARADAELAPATKGGRGKK